MVFVVGAEGRAFITNAFKPIFWHITSGLEIHWVPDKANSDFTKRPSDILRDHNAKHMTSIYEVFNFKQLVEEPTRVTLETASVIDDNATHNMCYKHHRGRIFIWLIFMISFRSFVSKNSMELSC